MTLIDLSLPVLALILLAAVLYDLRVEKRRRRAADHTVREVAMRPVELRKAGDPADDDDQLFDRPGSRPDLHHH